MYKILILLALVLSGCAYFTISATMCDQIAKEPGATIPEECRNYNEKEADKAYNKLVEEKKVSDQDIEFNKEEDK